MALPAFLADRRPALVAGVVLLATGVIGVAGAPSAGALPSGFPLGVSPSSAHRGDVVTLSGAACGGGGYLVRITVAGDPTPFVVAADDNGDWSTTYTLPIDATLGDHSIEAACDDFDHFSYFTYDQAAITVVALAPPSPSAMTSSGIAPAVQTVSVPIPTSGSVTLVGGGGEPVTTVTVAGQGTYQITPATGAITFTPIAGFAGVATAVTVRVTDRLGQTGETTYTPTVIAPDAQGAAPLATTGGSGSVQTTTVSLPSGTTIALLDGGGAPTNSVVVAGAGSYLLDPVTGVITFTPLAGFAGVAPAVTYRLTDQYGRTVTATYTPTVLGAQASPGAAPAADGRLPETGAPVGPTLAMALVLTSVGYALTRKGRGRGGRTGRRCPV